MPSTELLARLRDLHEELSSINVDLEAGQAVDDPTIEALGQLATDVSELIDQARANAGHDQLVGQHKSLSDRISEFDQQHPRVTQFLNQIADLLAMMGI